MSGARCLLHAFLPQWGRGMWPCGTGRPVGLSSLIAPFPPSVPSLSHRTKNWTIHLTGMFILMAPGGYENFGAPLIGQIFSLSHLLPFLISSNEGKVVCKKASSLRREFFFHWPPHKWHTWFCSRLFDSCILTPYSTNEPIPWLTCAKGCTENAICNKCFLNIFLDFDPIFCVSLIFEDIIRLHFVPYIFSCSVSKSKLACWSSSFSFSVRVPKQTR